MPKKKIEGDKGPDPWQMNKLKGAYYQSEENKTVTGFLIALRDCPKIDWDNPDDVDEAVKRYIALCYEYGFKPALTSFAVSVHYPYQDIQAVRKGRTHRNIRTMQILREFMSLCEAATREGMMQAKNPAGHIFELKAKYGWSDAPLVQIEQRDDLAENTSIKALAAKYLDSIVVEDHHLVKVKDEDLEEIESTAVIVEEEKKDPGAEMLKKLTE